jgi:hypothetical protein
MEDFEDHGEEGPHTHLLRYIVAQKKVWAEGIAPLPQNPSKSAIFPAQIPSGLRESEKFASGII